MAHLILTSNDKSFDIDDPMGALLYLENEAVLRGASSRELPLYQLLLDNIIKQQIELAELRERCADYENEIVYALRYLDSLGMTYDKHEREPEYQIKVSFKRALAKYKGDK